MNIQNLLTQYATLLKPNTSQDTPVRCVFDSASNYFHVGELLVKQDFQYIGLAEEYNLQKCRRNVQVYLIFALIELGDLFDHKVEGVNNTNADLVHIIDSDYTDKKGNFRQANHEVN